MTNEELLEAFPDLWEDEDIMASMATKKVDPYNDGKWGQARNALEVRRSQDPRRASLCDGSAFVRSSVSPLVR